MPTLEWTATQQRAIRTCGKSLIVSAAAGSGKTAVLAERCAYLVCDAPQASRCNIDELLVLTFTDAAATEMRTRIVQAIRARLEQHPGNARLREQAALADAAHISTIHAFCLWLIRRGFCDLKIDPSATLLDADEAAMLRGEVLAQVFRARYTRLNQPAHPLGQAVAHAPQGADAAAAFSRLVDDYGLGDDRDIQALILKLHAFICSLPDPDDWLRKARDSLTIHPERIILHMADALQRELGLQAEHGDAAVALIECGDPIGHAYGVPVRAYVERLRQWSNGLPADLLAVRVGGIDKVLAQFEVIRQQIRDYAFEKASGPRLGKGTDARTLTARDAARDIHNDVKKRLFSERLVKRYAHFSVAEMIDARGRTAPYVTTLVELENEFRSAYVERKRQLDVLDFNDLERYAFDLLRTPDTGEPSLLARTMHRRFAHVLVDEFQDINPLQQAIIRLVSRESDIALRDNLFVVGDVKQSIYRFRLAEPALFLHRLHSSRETGDAGEAVALQQNFRSRPEIIDFTNVIFRQLMPEGAGDIVYDAESELRAGRRIEKDTPAETVEVHLLERQWPGASHDDTDADTTEHGTTAGTDPSRWTPIEREAYVIGSRIRELISPHSSDHGVDRPTYRDIAVLLRASKINAERMAGILAAMGIPAYADVGGSLFGTLEVRDVMAALHVLDNFQQDIPLAGVLRSGILGEPLSNDELVTIRCLDRGISFHEVVRRYTEDGPDDTVRDHLRRVVHRIDRYRAEARRRPLSEVLWQILNEHGYLAYAGGLPNGMQRRSNLLKLHELARKFGTFRRQGLHRFLSFIRSLEDDDRQIAVAPSIGEADDVVRIMSIHQSKGLEFPIVFVAGLGTRFNLGDRSGRMIFERKAGIGLRAVDTERMIEYPTPAHTLVAEEVEQTTREEEMRILYVALTRARDKLVLVGTQRNLEKTADLAGGTMAGQSLTRFAINTATTPLDWLLPALADAPAGLVASGTGAAVGAAVEIHLHGPDEMAGWSLQPQESSHRAALLRAVAAGEPLPPPEALAPEDPEVRAVLSRIDYVYPSLASASVRAVVAASEFKGTHGFLYSEADELRPGPVGAETLPPPHAEAYTPGRSRAEAIHRGILLHRVLQYLDFSNAVDARGVASELQRLTTDGILAAEERDQVDRSAIEWFVSTPLADAIRQAGDAYRREFQFVTTEPTSFFDPSVGPAGDDRVLVRGIVDGIVPVGDGIEIVDFKSDAVSSDDAADRARRYYPQMQLYARAVWRIWKKPVSLCRLVFLNARQVIDLADMSDGLS